MWSGRWVMEREVNTKVRYCIEMDQRVRHGKPCHPGWILPAVRLGDGGGKTTFPITIESKVH